MTFYTLTKPGGPWIFTALGFTAVNGAVLDGSASTPAITSAPGPEWSVGGSVESGITRFASPGYVPGYNEPTDGAGAVWNATTNQLEYTGAALSATYASLAASDTASGIHFGADPTVNPFITIGNTNNSGGWAGTGSPPGTVGALAVYRKFGTNDGANTPITKSTQAIFIVAPYYGPTADDSAEAGSSSVLLSNTGTPYTQTLQTIAWEGTTQVQANVTASGLVSGVCGRIEVAGTASQVVSVRASAQTSAASNGTISEYIAFGQLASPAYGTVTAKYGVKVKDPILGETSIALDQSGWTGQYKVAVAGNADSAVSMVLVKGPDSVPGLTNMSLVAGTGQTRSMLECRDSGGTARFQVSSVGSLNMRGQQISVNDSSGNPQVLLHPTTGITFTDARNIVAGTTTGTKIGTGTTQKLGFWNATPVVQPSGTPAAATDAATTQTLVNDLRTKLLTLGLIA